MSFAEVVHDDPYLSMPKDARIALRRQTRAVFKREGFIKAAPVYDFSDPHSMLWCHDLILASRGIPSKVLTPIEIVKRIQIVCAEAFGVTRGALLSNRRSGELVRSRQIAIYLTRTITMLTFPQIGRRFGRDHSTCIFSFKKIEMQVEADPDLAVYINSLRQKVGA